MYKVTCLCVRLSMTVSCENQISKFWNPGLKSQVLRAKCNNIRRESWLLIGPAWLLKLEMMVDVDIATQGFLGRYQYIKKKRVLSFKFLGFLGDGFGVKGRVGVWVVVLSPSFVSHLTMVWIQIITQYNWVTLFLEFLEII